MRILKLLVGAALLCAAVNCNAQNYTIRPAPMAGLFGRDVNVYNQTGQLQQTIRPEPIGGPFGRGFNVYNSTGQLQQTIRPEPIGGPFGRGYTVHAIPR
jgi:hypothetical protein